MAFGEPHVTVSGLTTDEVIALQTLKNHWGHDPLELFTVKELARLEFARWLVENGKLDEEMLDTPEDAS